jgi:hypothetical protein
MDPTHSREMPSCSAIDLAEIRLSSKIILCFDNNGGGGFTVLGRPGRGTLQVEKSPHLNWVTHFLMVAYECFCQNGVNFLRCLALPCVSILLKSRASPDMLHFRLCNKKRQNSAHEQTPLSINTVDSVLHQKVGGVKDLSAPPHSERWIAYF